jgi:phosphohistidine swiveling domain-containing protein
MLAGILVIRRLLRIRGEARVVTREMMDAYRRHSSLPLPARPAALDDWLKSFGHRGPLESDPMRPRFSELRDVLLADLMQSPVLAAEAPARPSWWTNLFWPLFQLEERREWFRDSLMRRWQTIRARMLAEGERLTRQGELDSRDDVFWLRGEDLRSGKPLRTAAAANRAQFERDKGLDLPITASRDELEALLAASAPAAAADGQRVFPGIALSPAVFEGIVRRADELTTLLREGGLDASTVLVVPTLEPSWAVVFPRVGGVVAEVGGELSHASILLREARKPAIVNCSGIFRQARTGDRVRLDGPRGIVTLDPPDH